MNLHKTKIETTDLVYNLTTGCDQICFGGDCYAYQQMLRFGETWGYDWTPRLHKDRLGEPFYRKKPSLIFSPSMGDPMTPSLTDLEVYTGLDLMMICYWHRFQVQTKYEKRLPEFNYPSNVWLGVSICYEKDLIRLEYLLETDARIKYAYCEPLLQPMDPNFTGIDWVVIGAKTGVHPSKPQLDWVSHLVKRAEEAGAAVFMKSNLDLSFPRREFPDKEWMDKAYPEGLKK